MSCPIIDHLAKLDAEATQREWMSSEDSTGATVKGALYPVARVGCTEDANAIVSKHNAWPAILRVLRAADSFVTTNMERYEDTGEAFRLKQAIDALRALEVK